MKDCTPEAVECGKQFIAERRICISLKDNITEKLYIEVICSAGDETSRVIIRHEHTNVVYVEKNGVVLTDRRKEGVSCDASGDEDELRLSFSTVYEFAMEMPLDEIRFILETADLNRKAAEASLKGNFGHTVSKTVSGVYGRKYMGTFRTTFIINEEGVIERIITPKEVKTKDHAAQIL